MAFALLTRLGEGFIAGLRCGLGFADQRASSRKLQAAQGEFMFHHGERVGQARIAAKIS